MNNTIENQTTVASEIANNSETQAVVAAPKKSNRGRKRVNMTREAVFVHNADGSIVRRSKGKPAYNSKAMVYSVAWDYKGSTLPENAMFLRLAVVKDTRKPKQAENPASAPSVVVPSTAEILPTV